MSAQSFKYCAVTAALGLACAASGAASAQAFSVEMAGVTLGSLTFDQAGPTVTSVLDNTPLGVGDGTFTGTSRPARTDTGALVTQYIGRSDDRVISVLLNDGTALETVVSPTSEETELSDPGLVPPGVLDPVAGFMRIAAARGCPGPFRMYDGRRVIEVVTLAQRAATGQLSCDMDYRVVAGPGHMSPFYFENISMTITYDTRADQELAEISITAGVFTVYLTR